MNENDGKSKKQLITQSQHTTTQNLLNKNVGVV